MVNNRLLIFIMAPSFHFYEWNNLSFSYLRPLLPSQISKITRPCIFSMSFKWVSVNWKKKQTIFVYILVEIMNLLEPSLFILYQWNIYLWFYIYFYIETDLHVNTLKTSYLEILKCYFNNLLNFFGITRIVVHVVNSFDHTRACYSTLLSVISLVLFPVCSVILCTQIFVAVSVSIL